MSPERFRDLIGAYGADPRRWPEDEREAALAFMAGHAAEIGAALVDASAFDAMLGRHVVAAPGMALSERIVASGPVARRAWRQARLWWQGAGFAGLGVAGALTGALVIGIFLSLDAPELGDDGAYVITAFDDVSNELDE